MAIVFKDLDEIPAFTGEEDVKEQIQKLYNYIYALKDQIRYLLRNLGVENMNPVAWKNMQTDTLAKLIVKEVRSEEKTEDGERRSVVISNGRIFSAINDMVVFDLLSHTGYTVLRVWYVNDVTGEQESEGWYGPNSMQISDMKPNGARIAFEISSGVPTLKLNDERDMELFWKPNGDGTFSLSGRNPYANN